MYHLFIYMDQTEQDGHKENLPAHDFIWFGNELVDADTIDIRYIYEGLVKCPNKHWENKASDTDKHTLK